MVNESDDLEGEAVAAAALQAEVLPGSGGELLQAELWCVLMNAGVMSRVVDTDDAAVFDDEFACFRLLHIKSGDKAILENEINNHFEGFSQ